MRVGPKPLPFQLGLASLAAAGMAGGAHFDPQTLQDFFVGIQLYQKHPYKREEPEWPAIWTNGTAQMFHCPADDTASAKGAIVLIPSMINTSDILDLMPNRSLMRWLSGRGYDVYLLDWGDSTNDPAQTDMDAVVTHCLVPALESLAGSVHAIGYCMGGLLLAATAALRPDLIKSATFLAMPWNFHDERGALRARISVMRPMAIPYMTQYKMLPENWMQSVFATLDPESSIRKFANFARMDQSSARASLFVAVEDWINDGVNLPAKVAESCMVDWYEHNLPGEGAWCVAGQAVRAQDIKCPTFVIAAQDDKIVPPDSALAFAAVRTKCQTLLCPTGHIGLIAGGHVMEQVWAPIADWISLNNM